MLCTIIYLSFCHFWFAILIFEEFEDTRIRIRIRISKKKRQHNGQKKSTKGQKTIYKTYFCIYKTKDRVTRTPLITGGDLSCSGRVSNSCSTRGIRRVNLVTNPVISHERGKDPEVLTTSFPSFFDLRLWYYHVYPSKVSFNIYPVSAICRYIIGVFNIFVFFPFQYWNNTLTLRYWPVSCTREEKIFDLCTPDYFYCHCFIFIYSSMFFTPFTFQTGSNIFYEHGNVRSP